MLRLDRFSVLILLLGPYLTRSCEHPDCSYWDCGTCAVPCCTIDFIFPGTSTAQLSNLLVAVLKNGGPDGRYAYVPPLHQQGWDGEALPNNRLEPTMAFTAKATKTTSGRHFNFDFHVGAPAGAFLFTDRIYFAAPGVLALTPANLRVSSISGQASPNHHCDQGQNYKNIVFLLKALCVEFTEVERHGCSAYFPETNHSLFGAPSISSPPHLPSMIRGGQLEIENTTKVGADCYMPAVPLETREDQPSGPPNNPTTLTGPLAAICMSILVVAVVYRRVANWVEPSRLRSVRDFTLL